MSERQAKKLRKQENAQPEKKKADKSKILFNVIAVLIVLAFAGLAGYAISGVIKDAAQETAATDVADKSNIDTSTLKGYAEYMEMTYEEMVEKYGLDETVFTADMSTEEAFNLFTLENMAKMYDKDVATFVTEAGLPADVPTNVANTELSTDIMLKVNGIPYTIDQLKENGMSADITGETKWADAQAAVLEAANKIAQAEAEAAAAASEAASAETGEVKEDAETEDGGAE